MLILIKLQNIKNIKEVILMVWNCKTEYSWLLRY